MQLATYLAFNGNCEEAFSFYARCLGGKIETMLTWEGSPMSDQTPPGFGKKILHASLRLGDEVLMGADASPGHDKKPQGFCVSLSMDDPREAERIFKALSDGGNIQMPLTETFWAQRFGMFLDRFGIPWMINCGKPM